MAGRTKYVIHNLNAGLFNRIVRLTFEFVMRTVLIRTLGVEYLGLGSLFTSLLQMLSLAELGFGTAAVFSMYRPIAEKNEEKICALLHTYRRFYHTVGAIILVVGLCLIPFLDKLVRGTYPTEINITILYILYLTNTVISYFLFAYKATLFTAHQRDDVRRNIDTAVHAIMYFAQIIILFTMKNYYLYVLLLPIATIVINLEQEYWSRKHYPKYICKGRLEKEQAVDLTKRVIGMLSYQIGGVIYNNADILVVSAFLGLAALAKFTNYYYILSGLTAVMTIFVDAMTASVGNSIVTETLEKNQKLFEHLNTLFAWITGWWSICLLCLFQPFMSLWMGRENLLPMNNVFWFTVFFYFTNCTLPISLFKKAAGIWWEDKIRPLIGIGVNLVCNLWWVTLIGIDGVLLSSVVSTVFISIPWAAYFLFKCYLKTNLKKYLQKQILLFLGTAMIGATTYGLCQIIAGDMNMASLFITAILCLFIPNALYILLFWITGDLRDLNEAFQKIRGIRKG